MATSHSFRKPSSSPEEPVDPDKKAKRPWQAWLSGSPVMVISILLHVLFAIIATLFIVQRTMEKRKQNFSELSIKQSSPAAAAAQHATQVTHMKNSMSTPDIVHSLTVSDLSSVSLPEVNMPAESAPSSAAGKMQGTALNGLGATAGTGAMGTGPNVSIDMSTVAASIFGMPNGQKAGLAGRFYDLKQTDQGKPNDVEGNDGKFYEAVQKFVAGGFDEAFLKKFFQAPKTLYTPRIFVPYIATTESPKAFGVEDLVQPGYWLVLYQGKFRVPVGGTYRFVGYADNLIEVKVDGRLVLNEAGWAGTGLMENLNHPPTARYKYDVPGSQIGTFDFVCGDWMHFDDDSVHTIKVLIGDDNGLCGFWLMVEDKNHTYDKTPAGSPILPVFEVSKIKIPDPTDNYPPFDKDHPMDWPLVTDDDADASTPSSGSGDDSK